MGCCSSVDITNKYEIKREDEIKMGDGDLITFRGNGIISDGVSWMENMMVGNGDWSHVGLVFSKRLLPQIKGIEEYKDDELFLWDSGLSTNAKKGLTSVRNIETKKATLGVQIRPLRDMIKYSEKGSEIGWARLIDRSLIDGKERQYEVKRILQEIHKEFYGSMYQLNCCYLCGVFCPNCCCQCMKSCCNIRKKDVFCSEFVSIIYQRLGILPKNFDTSEILPVDLYESKLSNEYKRDKTFKQIVDKIIIILPVEKEITLTDIRLL